jgi:nucleoside-diphosphate-sugar epimerase
MAKLFGERYLEHLCHDTSTKYGSLRLIGIYGEGQDIDLDKGSIIPVLTSRAVQYPETEYRLLTNGEETRTYCYITDALKAFDRTLTHLKYKGSLPHPINIGSEKVITIKRIADLINNISGKDILLKTSDVASIIERQECSCQSAKSILGWEPTTLFEEGLKNVYKDIQSRLCES